MISFGIVFGWLVWFVFIRHIAFLLDWLVLASCASKSEKKQNKTQHRNTFFPCFPFLKLLEMRWTNSNYHPVLNSWFGHRK